MKVELTYLSLRENLKLLLEMQGIQYICDTRKELNAITKFTMESFTPDYVMELIGKLIQIKHNSKLGKDVFWQGCAINLSDVYAYRVKIETVYPTIASPNSHPSPLGKGITPIIPDNPDKDGERFKDPWQTFLTWAKSNLSRQSNELLQTVKVEINGDMIVIPQKLDNFLQRIITKFFTEEMKPAVEVIFEQGANSTVTE